MCFEQEQQQHKLRSKNINPEIKKKKNPQTLTKDGVGRVHGDLVLGRIINQTLCIGKSDVRRHHSVTLVVSYDLNTVGLP